MKKFVFQLDAVLRQRNYIERQCQRELAVVQGQMRELQNELHLVDNEVKTATEDLRQHHLTGSIDLNFLTAHRRFMLGMQRKATALVQRMSLLQRKVDDARVLLTQAATNRKAVDKLKERHFERWKAGLEAKETADLDEISLQMTYFATHDLQPEA